MKTELKTKKQKWTIEIIKASTSFEKELKILLDECPTQAVRSIALTEWTRKVVRLMKRLRHTEEEIIGCVKAFAKKGNWSPAQISYVLTEQGIKREDRYSEDDYSEPELSVSESYQPIELVDTFKEIITDLSKMDDKDLIDIDYKPETIAETSERNLREWISRMNEAQLRKNMKLVKAVTALLKRASELMQQRKQKIRQFSDGR